MINEHIQQLSDRLLGAAQMVTEGSVVADIGCDHGFLSIYLCQTGKAKHVYAMDVRTGPLERAAAHIEEASLQDKITCILSNGFEKLKPGDVDAAVVMGMGGHLISDILRDGAAVVAEMHELILGPQSDFALVRKLLRELRYEIIEEKMILENDKFYPLIKAQKISGETNSCERLDNDELEQECFDLYGELLVREKNPVLLQFLQQKQKTVSNIRCGLQQAQGDRVNKRMKELEKEEAMLRIALHYYDL